MADAMTRAKNELVSPEEYLSRVASFWDQTVADLRHLALTAAHARSLAAACLEGRLDFIALPAMSISGTKKSPRSKREPTSSSAGITAT